MELADQGVALVVEAPVKGVIVIRVAGDLDRTTAQGLVQVLDSQLQFCTTADRLGAAPAPTDQDFRLVVDLSDVRRVDSEGLRALHHAQYVARETGMTLQTTGLAGRLDPALQAIGTVESGSERTPGPANTGPAKVPTQEHLPRPA
jgi:anti-anti-sigma regulatory factor